MKSENFHSNDPHVPRHVYLAYGSNMHVGQMHSRCPDAELLGSGYLDGYRLVFRVVADIKASYIFERVPVAVYAISDSDRASLDQYEGYPSVYTDEYMGAVKLIRGPYAGMVVHPFAYVMTSARRGRYSPPSDYYAETIRQGYIQHGFAPPDVWPLDGRFLLPAAKNANIASHATEG